jgi:hypothetical protein
VHSPLVLQQARRKREGHQASPCSKAPGILKTVLNGHLFLHERMPVCGCFSFATSWTFFLDHPWQGRELELCKVLPNEPNAWNGNLEISG